VVALVDPPAGSVQTSFRFIANYTQPEGIPPVYVRFQLDDGDWLEMGRAATEGSAQAGILFEFEMFASEGNHTFRVLVFDGLNAVQTPRIDGPYVAPGNSVRPNAETFDTLRATIQSRYGVVITPLDVERGIFEGSFAWNVQVAGDVHFVSLDGRTVLDDPAPAPPGPAAPSPGRFLPGPGGAYAAAALAFAAIGASCVGRKRRGP
jgi:hypothetical protein